MVRFIWTICMWPIVSGFISLACFLPCSNIIHSSLLSIAESHPIVWKCHILLIHHSLGTGMVSTFGLLWWTRYEYSGTVSMWTNIFMSLGYIAKSGISGSYVTLYEQGWQPLHILHDTTYCLPLNYSYFREDEVVCNCSFDLYFPND
jgi:hypothetical protein